MRKLVAVLLLGLLATGLLPPIPRAWTSPTVTLSGGNLDTAGTSHTIQIQSPATGDRVVVAFTPAGDTPITDTWPSGWTTCLAKTQSSNGTVSLDVKYKDIESGSAENGQATMTITTSGANRKSSHASWKIAAGTYDAGTAPVCASSTDSGATINPDPPNNTGTGASLDFAWLVAFSWTSSAVSVSSCPTNYTTNCRDDHATGSGRTGTGSSYRFNTASSENPGTATLSASSTYVALTAAVAPSTGGTAGTLIDSTPLRSLVGGGLVR